MIYPRLKILVLYTFDHARDLRAQTGDAVAVLLVELVGKLGIFVYDKHSRKIFGGRMGELVNKREILVKRKIYAVKIPNGLKVKELSEDGIYLKNVKAKRRDQKGSAILKIFIFVIADRLRKNMKSGFIYVSVFHDQSSLRLKSRQTNSLG